MSATINYGIDLGTTNSSIAVCERGEIRVFQSTGLMNVTPSVIHISKSGRVLVGKQAYDIWVQDPQNTQAEFKRWMGYSDKLAFPASGRSVSAEELSAEVLKSLRNDAERQTHAKLNAAVITVPAAFGTLQCEATGRAARMAGFEQSPLLQEPIAAAIAYGASPASRDQRWMVFDLGGGTLDIAIVSTRDGMLAVLEHQGNNRLGGKDIDKTIAHALLYEPLAKSFHLPDPQKDAVAHRRLMRALVRQAEQVKISLTTDENATVDLFNLGEDMDGKPIEASFPITRAEMESRIAPLIDQCLELAARAMEGARMTGSQLDRVLLVGGPTQMPVIRQALASALSVKLDCSLDPMTVVSHGAALYASGIERTVADPSAVTAVPAVETGPKAVRIKLAYERASGTRQSPVSGLIADKSIHEVKIDAAGGFWTSGWLPLAGGAFHVDVMLRESKPITQYSLSAHDAKGNAIIVTPSECSISYMLPMSAPPLPHTIAVELSTAHGVTSFDPIFSRHCPLPAEARKTYKADRTLRPSEIGQSIPIKFWEVDVSEDPQEKWWAGCVHIRADAITRPIIESAELELVIKIDPSRKLSVEVFVPMLNQSFTNDVYVPDPPTTNDQVQQQLDLIFARLRIHQELYAMDRDDLGPIYNELQGAAEDIAEELGNAGVDDPDALLEPQARLRRLRMQLVGLEEQLNIQGVSNTVATQLRWAVPRIGQLIENHGTAIDQEEFAKVAEQYRRYSAANDTRGLKWVQGRIWDLHYSIVEDRMWYWQEQLANCKSPATKFLNRAEAKQRLAEAEAANARNDLAGLRSAIRGLWKICAPDQGQAAMEQAAQSGLRGT